jgi:hypothetical protein
MLNFARRIFAPRWNPNSQCPPPQTLSPCIQPTGGLDWVAVACAPKRMLSVESLGCSPILAVAVPAADGCVEKAIDMRGMPTS